MPNILCKNVICIPYCNQNDVKIIAAADNIIDPNHQITTSLCVKFADVAGLIQISRAFAEQ